MVGMAATVALMLLVFLLVPVRFTKAVRRALRDPEFRGLFVLAAVALASGTLFYRRVEGWNLLDAFYFSSITLTTVGYGDLAPDTAAAKLFTVFYIFTGIGIIFGFVDTVAKNAVEQRQERRILFGRRRDSEQERTEN
jgi:voltage-gated potassium channel